jgi:D-sedoheptulose 7-phosphate isomerase
MNNTEFLKNYVNGFSKLLEESSKISISKLIDVSDTIKEANNNGNKVLIFGNGGSSAIASHFSVDLTKNAGFRCVNFNEADLLTCFSNDFGYERWVEKSIDFYADEGDVIILISSSGNSQNMVNGITASRNKNVHKIITFTGFDNLNHLRKLGDINIWVDSKAYNYVENIHQFFLLSIVDLLIGNSEYSA